MLCVLCVSRGCCNARTRERAPGSRAHAHSRRRSFPGAPSPSPGVEGCVLGPSGRVYGRYWKFAHIMGQHTFPKVAGACSKSPSPPRPRPSAPSRGFEVKRAWCVASYAGTAVTAVRLCTSPPLRFARGSSIRGCTYRMCVRVLFFFFGGTPSSTVAEPQPRTSLCDPAAAAAAAAAAVTAAAPAGPKAQAHRLLLPLSDYGAMRPPRVLRSLTPRAPCCCCCCCARISPRTAVEQETK